ncbi:hypothetical protein GQ54DRAFT_340947 [Martensiomyces pterosporus]|nr:hypothetical protein GQ54DRAFT_340947 [Martensiomyces pterosporus]
MCPWTQTVVALCPADAPIFAHSIVQYYWLSPTNDPCFMEFGALRDSFHLTTRKCIPMLTGDPADVVLLVQCLLKPVFDKDRPVYPPVAKHLVSEHTVKSMIANKKKRAVQHHRRSSRVGGYSPSHQHLAWCCRIYRQTQEYHVSRHFNCRSHSSCPLTRHVARQVLQQIHAGKFVQIVEAYVSDKSYMLNMLQFAENSVAPQLMAANLSRIPMYDVGLGFGAPAKVVYPFTFPPGFSIFTLEGKDSGLGVYIHTPEKMIEHLQADRLLRHHISVTEHQM